MAMKRGGLQDRYTGSTGTPPHFLLFDVYPSFDFDFTTNSELTLAMLFNILLCAAGFATTSRAHVDHQKPIAGPHKSLWYNALPGDGGTQVFW